MSARPGLVLVAASALLLGYAPVAAAQECAAMPLLGRRVAVGAQLSHSSLGEMALGASLTGRVLGPLRLGGAYHAARLDDIDRLRHEGRVELSAPFSLAGIDICPGVGAGQARLATELSGVRGRVTAREARLGATFGRSFAIPGAVRATPFIEPLLVRRTTSWESVDADDWRVSSDSVIRETQLWLGVSVATSRGAVVARLRPGVGSAPREVGVAVVTTIGRR